MVYQARPGKSVGKRASNIHMLIQFFLGAVGSDLAQFCQVLTLKHVSMISTTGSMSPFPFGSSLKVSLLQFESDYKWYHSYLTFET